MPMDQVDEKRRRANWFELAFTLPDRAKTMKTVGPTTFGGRAGLGNFGGTNRRSN